MTPPPPHRRLELYCRAETRGLAGRRQAAVRDRVEELAETHAVFAVDHYEWPRKLAVDGPGPTDERAQRAFDRFSDWARDNDVRLHPAFSTRECYDWETGDRYTALVLPVIALAVYEDDDLAAVYPHTEGDEQRTVFDGLDELRAGTATGPDRDRTVPAE